MARVHVFFDVDGTLRCNCTPTCEDPNESVVTMLRLFGRTKNMIVHVWSGGGRDYAARFVRLYGLDSYVSDGRIHSKLDPEALELAKTGLAVDDIQDTALGLINIIVREK